MSAILNFLFPGEPRDSRSSWLLLAARVVFGLLLMSHGIAKLQNFEALEVSQRFDDATWQRVTASLG